MQCVDAVERLLSDELGTDAELQEHVAACAVCAHVAGGLGRLDSLLRRTVLLAPPLDLQRQLLDLAVQASRPQRAPWWQRLLDINPAEWWAQRPQMIAAQGLAALMLAVASWQALGFVSSFGPVIGDVGYAMQLVAASPATLYLSGIQIDLQSLGVWSLVGLGGWLISENGLVGRRITRSVAALP